MFDERTTVGMVRLYSAEAAEKLVVLFAQASQRQLSRADSDGLQADYQDSAKDRLDSLFG
jgi:hypothetical protein